MELVEFWLRIGNIVASVASGLIGVSLGWFLARRTQEKTLKASEIRNELEKAYGTLYSIVSSEPEKMVKVDGGDERMVIISQQEKSTLDRLLMIYPHMFPLEIVVLWREKIRKLMPVHLRGLVKGETAMRSGVTIPVSFKEEIMKEYEQRLEEYYKTTGRWKKIKDLPKVART